MLLDKVRHTIEKYKLLSYGDKVLCAVSGGADSLCLLHVMLNLMSEYGLEVYVANVNHLIRGEESDEDSAFVKRVCEAANVRYYYREYDVPRLSSEMKIGTEECGRKLRYDFFDEISTELGGAKIATAHNLNDNAETVLFRLIRGASGEGLGGIKYKRENIIRPLLDASRSEIEAYLYENNITWRTDSSNLSPDYSRNKLRLNVFPQLREIFSDADRKIVSASELVREDNEYLNHCALEFEKEFGSEEFFYCNKFNLLPMAIKRRVSKNYLKKWGLKEVSTDKINMLINLAENESGKEFDINGLVCAIKCYDKIMLKKTENVSGFSALINIGDTLEVGNYIIQVKILDKPIKKYNNNIAVFDADMLNGPFTVRYRHSGDKMAVQGLGGRKKLSDIFSDEKIDSILRDKVPLVEYEGEILYLCGLRQSECYAVESTTEKFLVIEYLQRND